MDNSAGTYVRSPSGYTAFVPNSLPPELQWSTELVSTLSEADHLLGRLAGEGGKLPNPHILIRPFITREAVLSSRIEGTQATLGEILAAEAGANIERNLHDMQEVNNYILALEYGIERLKSLPLSLRLINELHGKLMVGVRGQHATPGEFRRTQNWIGAPGCTLTTATYIPPPPDKLMECLGDWEKFLHQRTLPPLIQIALAHYQFEAIHPFLDGNGRIGRLLITLFLIERNILPTPLLYLSAFFEATRQDYYNYLRYVSERGEWNNWLQYFLNGVARQAEDALDRAERINKIIDNWKLSVAELASSLPIKLIDMLATNPFVTINKASEKLGVAFTTVRRIVERFEKLEIVTQVNTAKRNRVYCAKTILDILEEPAHLSASLYS